MSYAIASVKQMALTQKSLGKPGSIKKQKTKNCKTLDCHGDLGHDCLL